MKAKVGKDKREEGFLQIWSKIPSPSFTSYREIGLELMGILYQRVIQSSNMKLFNRTNKILDFEDRKLKNYAKNITYYRKYIHNCHDVWGLDCVKATKTKQGLLQATISGILFMWEWSWVSFESHYYLFHVQFIQAYQLFFVRAVNIS